MNYKNKYDELINLIGIKDVSEQFPEASDFEKIIISLRKNG